MGHLLAQLAEQASHVQRLQQPRIQVPAWGPLLHVNPTPILFPTISEPILSIKPYKDPKNVI